MEFAIWWAQHEEALRTVLVAVVSVACAVWPAAALWRKRALVAARALYEVIQALEAADEEGGTASDAKAKVAKSQAKSDRPVAQLITDAVSTVDPKHRRAASRPGVRLIEKALKKVFRRSARVRPTAGCIALVACTGLLAQGCAATRVLQDNPRAQLRAAQVTFDGTVKALTEARKTGAFEQSEADDITILIREGRLALEAWADAVKAGYSAQDKAEAFKAIMLRLNQLRDTYGSRND